MPAQSFTILFCFPTRHIINITAVEEFIDVIVIEKNGQTAVVGGT